MTGTRLDGGGGFTNAASANIGDAGIYTYPTGSDRLFLMLLSSEASSAGISDVTEKDGSKALTLVVENFFNGEFSSIWYLKDADIPSDNVSNGFTVNGPDVSYNVYMFTLEGMDQTPTIDDTDAASNSGSPVTITLTSTTGGYAGLLVTDQAAAPTGPTFSDEATELFSDDHGSYQSEYGEKENTDTSTDLTYTGGSSTRKAGFSLAPAAGGITVTTLQPVLQRMPFRHILVR